MPAVCCLRQVDVPRQRSGEVQQAVADFYEPVPDYDDDRPCPDNDLNTGHDLDPHSTVGNTKISEVVDKSTFASKDIDNRLIGVYFV